MRLIIPCEFDAHPGDCTLSFQRLQGDTVCGSIAIRIAEADLEVCFPIRFPALSVLSFIRELELLQTSQTGVARLWAPPIPHQLNGLWIIRRERWYDGIEGQRIRLDICGVLVASESGSPAVMLPNNTITYDHQDMAMRFQCEGLRIDLGELTRIIAAIRHFADERQLHLHLHPGNDVGP